MSERRRADRYDPAAIEAAWQRRWEETGLYRVTEDPERPKFYFLTMYPYPSGDLHIGHWYAMAPSDAAARLRRMRGRNVLFPIGFDAFGLPAENAAISHGIHPYTWTMANIERMRGQLRSMGAMFDWSREIVTADPDYYRWNQWFFLKFYERGLAYRALAPVDWCPKDQTTLAREQVVGPNRVCERCGTPVVKRNLEQWFFKITAYADELLDFSEIDWPERVETMQRNWIGRSEGAEIAFPTETGSEIRVFTTRPDTLWGATFMVLAPEHPLVDELTTPAQRATVEAYKVQAARSSDIERLSTEHPKTGVPTGGHAINPGTGERIPVWIADYVLLGYGTGAIMGVPAHDQRDFEFARAYGLPVRVVVQPPGRAIGADEMTEAWPEEGAMVNSGPLDGVPAGKGPDQSIEAAIRWLEAHGAGRGAVSYRLRDWLISRQRYWGTPIPIVYCSTCGVVPVPEDQLPVLLPEDAEFTPTGQSPLKRDERFRRTACPRCGREDAERETDTMDTFVDSSWYQYRYLSPHDPERPFDPEQGRRWLPVDQYTGGIEHAVLHLLYTRFFTKVMRDMGLVWFDEPMRRLFNQGTILGEDNEKMSKSRGNVVDPDEQVSRYGADTVRAYLMFMRPWEEGGPWSSRDIEGVSRFLHRVWALVVDPGAAGRGGAGDDDVRRLTHRTIRRVTEDAEGFHFNTAIAALMEFSGALARVPASRRGTGAWREAIRALILLLAPICPHVAEELWARIGGPYSVHQQPWPSYDEALVRREQITLVLQVNGKVRDRITVPADISDDDARRAALENEKVRRSLNGGRITDVIVVPGRLVNVVVQ